MSLTKNIRLFMSGWESKAEISCTLSFADCTRQAANQLLCICICLFVFFCNCIFWPGGRAKRRSVAHSLLPIAHGTLQTNFWQIFCLFFNCWLFLFGTEHCWPFSIYIVELNPDEESVFSCPSHPTHLMCLLCLVGLEMTGTKLVDLSSSFLL